MKNFPEWFELYPQGTIEGDQEQMVFVALTRNKKWKNWRSVTAISKETNLNPDIVEKIIYKYFKIGLIIQNPKNSEFWGYVYCNLDEIDEDKDVSILEHEIKKVILRKKINIQKTI